VTHRFARQSGRRSQPAGFTLVEMMVAIGIIVILAALTVSATVAVARKSEVRQARNVIRLLDMALQDWETSSDRKLSWGDGSIRSYDVDYTETQEDQVSAVLERLMRVEGSRAILAQINTKYLQLESTNGIRRVTDPWSRPMFMIHPGRVADPTFFPGDATAELDDDGTVRVNEDITGDPATAWEQQLGVCRSRQVCFVSAGPDELFGIDEEFPNLSGQPLQDAKDEAKRDNIYSYEVITP
jgi:prepilin-type N-terminal cleavage/methylation domain-containing protein